MLGLLKRYRELFVIGTLLVVPLVTYFANSKHGRELNIVDRSIIWISSPITRTMTACTNWIRAQYKNVVDIYNAREENIRLRKENQDLKNIMARAAEIQAENERLRRMIGFVENSRSPVLTASVIGEAPVMNLLTIKIGKGSEDGVQRGMAVAASEGIVGRVLNSASHSADVLLISDANFVVPVRAQRSRARAKIIGQGLRAKPMLAQALRTDDFEDGDILVTSGTDGVFPKGLTIGRVTNVIRPSYGMFLSAEVVPTANIAMLEEVFVLLGPPGLEEMPSAFLRQP